MSETTQPVVQPANGAAAPAPAAAANAPDELDQLLAQFEKPAATVETKPTESKATTKPELPTDLKDLADWARAERDRKDSETVRSDIEKARGVIRSQLDEIGVNIPDEIMEGTIEAMARKDARIRVAWAQRGANPQAWNDVVQGMAKRIRKDFESLPNKEATEDKDAVRLAVRSASTRAPEPEKFDPTKLRNMTDAEFNRYTRSLRGA